MRAHSSDRAACSRLIAVLADANHVALQPWVVDTVNFVMTRRR